MARPAAPLPPDDLARFLAFVRKHGELTVRQTYGIDGNTIWRVKRGMPVTPPTRAKLMAAVEADAGDEDTAEVARQAARLAAEHTARGLLAARGADPSRAPVIARYVVPDSPLPSRRTYVQGAP